MAYSRIGSHPKFLKVNLDKMSSGLSNRNARRLANKKRKKGKKK